MPVVLYRRSADPRLEQAVYVGRPSKWGNPFVVGVHGTVAECVAKFEQYMQRNPRLCADAKKELKGRNLVCWCKRPPCHGYTLLRIANEP